MEISQRRMTSVFKDCCRLLSCLLVFSGLVSAWACLCVWLAGLLGQWWAWQLLSVRGPQVTHTFSILYPSTQPSQRNGKDRCWNQCEVCGNKRQQLTEKLCRAAAYMPRCGMTQICSYFSHTHVFVVLLVLLSHSVCGNKRGRTGCYWSHLISTLS